MNNSLIALCGCGHGKPEFVYPPSGKKVLHAVGKNGCARKIADGNLVPTNFREEGGVDVCDVKGYTITSYTLRVQRGYSKHTLFLLENKVVEQRPENDIWSLPKDESSINSLPDET